MLGLASTVSSSSTPESKYSCIFDGTGDYIELGDNLDLGTADFSISFWAYVPEGASQNFISKFEDAGNRWFITTQGTSQLQFLSNVSSSTTMSNSYGGDAVPENEWFHGVVTCDRSDASGGLTVYVNAVAGTANAADATTLSNSGNLRFGRQNTSYIGANSKMADVAIWNVALNLANVQAIYNSGRPTNLTFDSGNYDNSSALQAYYKMGNGTFDDKANGAVHDQHASGFGSNLIVWDGSTTGDWNETQSGNTTLSANSGNLRAAADASGAYGTSRSCTTVVGSVYRVDATINVDNASGGTGNFRVSNNLNLASQIATLSTSTGTFLSYFTATATTTYVGVIDTAADNTNYMEIEEISVRKLNGLPALTSGDTAFSSDTP